MSVPAGFDPVQAHRMMVRMRLLEEGLVNAWADGLVPGEYHSGIGEEGINAGIILHLSGHDAMALDHRNSAPLIGRGADPAALMLEVLGSEQGMNRGQAGHMHVLEPSLHAAADGMVGAAGPLAVGNAIANVRLNPGRIAVAFHGEAAMNQGMLMESYNMAVAWNLPVLFVCKDNRWSITTYSKDVTGGGVLDRARAAGLKVETASGHKVRDVYAAAGKLIARARDGQGPGFLYVTCHRPSGHFEGDPIVRMLRNPRGQAEAWGPGIQAAATAPTGGTRRDRNEALKILTKRGVRAARDWTLHARKDPIRQSRAALDSEVVDRVEAAERAKIEPVVAQVRASIGPRPTFGVAAGGAR